MKLQEKVSVSMDKSYNITGMDFIVKHNNNIKLLISSVVFFLIALNSMLPVKWLEATGLDAIIGLCLCCLNVVLVFNGSVHLNRKKVAIMAMTGGIGVIAVLSGIYFSVYGYISYGVFFLIIMEALVLVINSREQVKFIMMAVSLGGCGAFFVLWIVSILFGTLGSEQYCSVTGNPNALGLYSVIGFCCSIYLRNNYHGKSRLIFLIVEGISIGFIIFTRSRTAIIAMIMILILEGLYHLIAGDKRYRVRRCVKYICLILMCIYGAFISVTTINHALGLNDNVKLKDILESTFSVQLDMEYKNVRFGDVLSESSKRTMKGIADDGSFSSGRTEIWKCFGEKVTLYGHSKGTLEIKEAEYNAHNAYLQMAYSYGIIAGVLYIMLSMYIAILCLLRMVKSLKSRTMSYEFCYLLMIFAACFVFSMLSSSVSPFTYYLILMMCYAVVPIIGNEDV